MLARCGVVTASEVDALVTPTFKARTGQGVQTYLYQKLSEKILGYTGVTGSTWAMDQGNVVEKIAVPWYEFAHDVKIDRVGFITSDDGLIGCSPDGLLGDEGGIEVKSPQAKNHLENLLTGKIPSEYLPQIHMSMFVTGRKWWKFLSYHTYLPPLVVHVDRDEAIQELLRAAIDPFLDDLEEAHRKVTAMMQTKGRP